MTPPRCTRPAAAGLLVALQLVALFVVTGVTVLRFHVWADVDERPHYDYIQRIATQFEPPRPTDLVSPEVQAITDRTWPKPSPTNRTSIGLAGRSYEAIEPPLYYVVAAPSFLVVSDYRDKVFAVRAFDLALLAIALLLFWRLAVSLAPREIAVPGFALALAVMLWPGLTVRGVTLGNTPLELVLTAAFLFALWRADREERAGPLARAAVLLGLGLLTKLALLCLVPVFLVVVARRLRRGTAARRTTVALAALPAVILAPWLALNLIRYDALTVNITGAPGVVAPVSSHGLIGRVGDLPDRNWRLLEGVLPQEWRSQLDVWWVHVAIISLGLALFAGVVALLATRNWPAWFLALPFFSGLALINATYLLTSNDAFLLRYVYATLPPAALGVGLLLAPRTRLAIFAAAVPSLVAAALWAHMFGTYYFTNVGHLLGV